MGIILGLETSLKSAAIALRYSKDKYKYAIIKGNPALATLAHTT
ncbi:hypothetical protein [Chlorogloeopsis fritschii]|nr:hypothetical protein [Chlorogloeopsis fritschii]